MYSAYSTSILHLPLVRVPGLSLSYLAQYPVTQLINEQGTILPHMLRMVCAHLSLLLRVVQRAMFLLTLRAGNLPFDRILDDTCRRHRLSSFLWTGLEPLKQGAELCSLPPDLIIRSSLFLLHLPQ